MEIRTTTGIFALFDSISDTEGESSLSSVSVSLSGTVELRGDRKARCDDPPSCLKQYSH